MILHFPKFGTPEVKKAETSKLFFSHLKKNEPKFYLFAALHHINKSM